MVSFAAVSLSEIQIPGQGNLSPAGARRATRRWSATLPLSDPDEIYRQATQEMWDQTRQQKRLASKIVNALNLELLQRDVLREFFVGECGFQILDVRLSRDNTKAFILWSAYPAQLQNAQIGLTRQLKQLRAAVAQRIQTRAVPRLEFRQNKLTTDQAVLESLLDDLKAEREEEEQEQPPESEEHAERWSGSDEDTEESADAIREITIAIR